MESPRRSTDQRLAQGLLTGHALGDRAARSTAVHALAPGDPRVDIHEQDEPGDYVVASGVARTVGDLVGAAFAAAGIATEGRIVVNDAFVRPPEATPPLGDPSRARRVLGWRAETSFEAMIAEMVEADLRDLRELG